MINYVFGYYRFWQNSGQTKPKWRLMWLRMRYIGMQSSNSLLGEEKERQFID